MPPPTSTGLVPAAAPVSLSAPTAPVRPYPLTPEFQRALVWSLSRDRDLWAVVGDLLSPAALSDPTARLVALAARSVAEDLGHGPGHGLLVLQRVRRWVNDGTHTAADLTAAADLFEEMNDRADRGDLPDAEALRAEVGPLLQGRARVEAAFRVSELAARGAPVSEAIPFLEAADRVGVARADLGDGFEDLLAFSEPVERFALGLPEIDGLLMGGVRRQTVTLIGAPSGVGKSTALTHILGSLLLAGRVVLMATLENPKGLVKVRLVSNLTGVPITALEADPGVALGARRILEDLRPRMGDFRLEFFPEDETTVVDLARWVRLYQQRTGNKVDALLVDGIDHLVPLPTQRNRNSNSYTDGRSVSVALSALAKAADLSVIATSHVKDNGGRLTHADGTKVPAKEDLADSQHRSRKADTVLTAATKRDEAGQQWVYLALAKSRWTAGSGMILGPLPMDLGCGRFVMPTAPLPLTHDPQGDLFPGQDDCANDAEANDAAVSLARAAGFAL